MAGAKKMVGFLLVLACLALVPSVNGKYLPVLIVGMTCSESNQTVSPRIRGYPSLVPPVRMLQRL